MSRHDCAPKRKGARTDTWRERLTLPCWEEEEDMETAHWPGVGTRGNNTFLGGGAGGGSTPGRAAA